MILELLGLALYGANALGGLVTTALYADEHVLIPETLSSMSEVKVSRELWREDGRGKCYYTGLMVPFVRDWPVTQVSDGMEVTIPPSPEEGIYGQAILLNEKVCKGKPVQSVLLLGSISKGNWRMRWQQGSVVQAVDFNGLSKKTAPPWMAQVFGRIKQASAQEPVAYAFYSKSKGLMERDLPDEPSAPAVSPEDKPAANPIESSSPFDS